jgi:NitT/TauT family transport system substrate-binding protein
MKSARFAAVFTAFFFASSLAAGAATNLDKVSLRLNWYVLGFHAPIFLGIERGFFAAEGLELTVNEGRGSGVSTQSVAAKSDDFAIADASSVIFGASKGMPIKVVMSLMNQSQLGVISRADNPIKVPKDLEGKKLAVTAGDSFTQLLPAVIDANHLNAEKIHQVFIDPDGKVVAVLEKRIDALLGGVDGQNFQLEEKGVPAVSMKFADIGVNTVSLAIIANDDLISSKPDLIRRFAKAMRRSFEAAIKEPDAAVAATLKFKSDVSATLIKNQMMVDFDLLFTPASKVGGIGYAASEDWNTTYELLKKYRDLKTDRKASTFYTNEFLPAASN